MNEKFLLSVPLAVNGSTDEAATLKMSLSMVPQPEAQFDGDVVVYADEQGPNSPKGGKDFAVGFEFGPAPIVVSTIADALARRTCTGRCSRDKTTRERKQFFHASDDCNDCRGILASTIRHELHERFFVSLRWHFPNAKPGDPEGPELHQQVIAMVLGIIANIAGVQRIVFKFERTQRVRGSFKDALVQWLHEDIGVRIKAMVQSGLMHCIVPIDVSDVGKEEPGIQVCDHLLWRENRELSGKPEKLVDVGMLFSESQDSPPYKITVYNHGNVVLPVMNLLPNGRVPGDFPWREVVDMFYNIEVNVHELAKSIPPKLRHLEHLFTDASRCTRGKVHVSLEDFVQLHNAFLAVVGLYGRQCDVSAQQRQRVADFAQLAIVIGQRRETRAISMLSDWRVVRQKLIAAGDTFLT